MKMILLTNLNRNGAVSKTSRSSLDPLRAAAAGARHPAHSRAPVWGFNARMLLRILTRSVVVFTVVLLGSFTARQALAGDDGPKVVTAFAGGDGPNVVVSAGADADDQPVTTPAPPHKQNQFFFRTVGMDDDGPASKQTPWLGVGVSDSPEPLSAQLGLKPGEGLVVNYVATNSPAAEAGLRKNDVLVELDGQMLVDPIQLRKLVQMHADGDNVKIEFYRAGKKESATAKLSLRPFNQAFIDGDMPPNDFRYQPFFAPKPPLPPMGKGELTVGGGGGQSGPPLFPFDKEKLTIQVQQAQDQARRAMDQAQRAIQEAMQQAQYDTDGVNRKLWTIRKKLGNYATGGVAVGKDATVVVKNEGESVRTMVKKDDSGTYVIVADPAKHLTAHDPNGKLLFDGLIESPEQQQKVPKGVWKKVQPMLDQLAEPDGPTGTPQPPGSPEEE